MNRRNFLVGSGVATAGMLPILTPIARGQNFTSSNPNPQIDVTSFDAARSASAIALANQLTHNSHPSDWAVVSNTTSAVSSLWQQAGLEEKIRSFYPTVTPSMVNSKNIDVAKIHLYMQKFQPSVTLAQVQGCFNYIDRAKPEAIQRVIDDLGVYGMRPHFETMIQQSARASQTLGSSLIEAAYREEHPHLLTIGSRGCDQAGVALDAAGIALGVLVIMSGPAGVLALAIWEGVIFWGGTSVAAMLAVEMAIC